MTGPAKSPKVFSAVRSRKGYTREDYLKLVRVHQYRLSLETDPAKREAIEELLKLLNKYETVFKWPVFVDLPKPVDEEAGS